MLPVAGLLFFRYYQKTQLDLKKTGVRSGKVVLASAFIIFIVIWIAVIVVLSGRLAMILALKNNDVDTVKFLLDSGISARMRIVATGEKRYPLHYAAMKGSSEIARLLITKGADVNCLNELSQTPLIRAVIYKNGEAVRLLLEQGAKIDVRDVNNSNAWDIAQQNDNRDIEKLLLKHGAKNTMRKR